MTSLSLSNTTHATDGIRPVNLRTDLAPLADLIEIAFADSMDSSGRAAVREMRSLSKVRPILQALLGINELAQGISFGYVCVLDGNLVGNVSIYPADIPAKLGKTWIIANVAVHPDYRGRGIARKLMQVSMESIRNRQGRAGILQVDYNNPVAIGLYESLGFRHERVFTHWRRSSALRVPTALHSEHRINRRRDDEWRQEMELASRVRPNENGGLGWQRPVHEGLFRPSIVRAISNTVNLRSIERLVIRDETETQLRAVLWVETAFAVGPAQLTLLVQPEFNSLYDEPLINLAVRRFGARGSMITDHPADDELIRPLLLRYGFQAQRSFHHMRWEPDTITP